MRSEPHIPLLLAALRAAWAAGREILRVYETDFAVETKSDASPLTEADRRSQQRIREILADADASIPFLGEEGREIPFDERKAWKRFWLVDPLDGTKEFVSRNGEFTVNIALVEKKRAVFGLVFAPVLSLAYFGDVPSRAAYRLNDAGALAALADRGAEWEEVARRSLRLPAETTRVFTVAASRSHRTPETDAYIGECRRLFGEVVTRSSGSSLKMCQVAEGLADVYPRIGPTYEWDVAAGQAVVEAAGGSLCRAGSRDPLVYNKPDLHNPSFVCVNSRYRDKVPLG